MNEERIKIISLLYGLIGHQIEIQGKDEMVTTCEVRKEDWGYSFQIQTQSGKFDEKIYPKK